MSFPSTPHSADSFREKSSVMPPWLPWLLIPASVGWLLLILASLGTPVTLAFGRLRPYWPEMAVVASFVASALFFRPQRGLGWLRLLGVPFLGLGLWLIYNYLPGAAWIFAMPLLAGAAFYVGMVVSAQSPKGEVIYRGGSFFLAAQVFLWFFSTDGSLVVWATMAWLGWCLLFGDGYFRQRSALAVLVSLLWVGAVALPAYGWEFAEQATMIFEGNSGPTRELQLLLLVHFCLVWFAQGPANSPPLLAGKILVVGGALFLLWQQYALKMPDVGISGSIRLAWALVLSSGGHLWPCKSPVWAPARFALAAWLVWYL